MPAAPRLPFRLTDLTLRVCADLGWKVMVHCPRCRYTTMLHLAKLAGAPWAAVPLAKLLGDGVLRCRAVRNGKSCDGQPADEIDVSYLDVGHQRRLATWTLTETSVRLSEPAAD
jgi:hypothetical protein